mgnify:CR=1 FL=1
MPDSEPMCEVTIKAANGEVITFGAVEEDVPEIFREMATAIELVGLWRALRELSRMAKELGILEES